MGYEMKIDGYYRIKKDKDEYHWPCEIDKNRTITIFKEDVLSKGEKGFIKHTGLCCFGIQIPDEDLEYHDSNAILRIL
jgi:hypothetical protein